MSGASDSDGRLEHLADLFVKDCRDGLPPSVEEFAARYPEDAGKLREILPALCMMEQARKRVVPFRRRSLRSLDAAKFEFDDYVILREIGRGGMGIVYEARQKSLARRVALKVLPVQFASDSKQFSRFEREAKAAASLHHTNIVSVFDVGSQNGTSFYSMQFIEGESLDHVIRSLRTALGRCDVGELSGRAGSNASVERERASSIARMLLDGEDTQGNDRALSVSDRRATHDIDDAVTHGVISQSTFEELDQSQHQPRRLSRHWRIDRQAYWQSVARIGLQAAAALGHAHERGVIHRDIKPANLLIDAYGTVWVTDFGLAKSEGSDDLTTAGDLLGTLRYLPQESLDGRFDARGDVYALGLTLYELVALEAAFPANDRAQLLNSIVHQSPPQLLNRVPDVPRDLATMIHKAIEREPERRYQTAEELFEDLSRFLHDEPILARRTSALERLGRWSRRNRDLAAAISGIVLLLLVISISSVVAAAHFWEQEADQRRLVHETEALAARNAKLLAERQSALQRSLGISAQLDGARKRAERQERQTRQNLYFAQMSLAQQALSQHRGFGRAASLLEAWRPQAGESDLRDWEWYFINAMVNREEHAFVGHEDVALGVDWKLDGSQIASVDRSGSVVIWDSAKRSEIRRWSVPDSSLYCVAWNQAGDRLAIGGDRGVTIWDESTGRHQLTESVAPVFGLEWSPDDSLIATVLKGEYGRSTLGQIIDAAIGAEIRTFPIASIGEYNAELSWSPDGLLLAVPDARAVTVWNILEDKRIARLESNDSFLQTVAFHPTDSSRLASADRDSTITVWDLATRTATRVLRGHTHGVASIAWSPDGQLLASGSWDGTARVWELSTGAERARWNSHPRHCFDVAWNAQGDRLTTAGDDNLIKVWNLSHSTPFRAIVTDSDSPITDLRFSLDGESLISTDARRVLTAWDSSRGDRVGEVPAGRRVRASCIDPTGVIAASALDADQVLLHHLPSGEQAASLEIPDASEAAVIQCSPRGERLAVANRDGEITIWDMQSQTQIAASPGKIRPVLTMAWSQDGQRLALCSDQGGITVWSNDRTTPSWRTFAAHRFRAMQADWSSDGRRLATCGLDNTLKVWDVEAAQEVVQIEGHNENVVTVAWGPNDHRLLSGDARGTLILWDVDTRQQTLELRAPAGKIFTACWSSDGRRIAATNGSQIFVWDASPADDASMKTAPSP